MSVRMVSVVRRARLLAVIGLCAGAGAGSLDGQTVETCEEDECHVVPFAGGRGGGFVGRARSGADGVQAFLVCRGNRTTKVVTRELVPGHDGVVAELFGVDDGTDNPFFCYLNEDATIEIRGLTDGGWYWLTDDSHTAVAPLLSKDALGNRKVRPTNPGSPDILIEANRAGTASFVKQLSTGRVGILSHVLPVPRR